MKVLGRLADGLHATLLRCQKWEIKFERTIPGNNNHKREAEGIEGVDDFVGEEEE